MQESEKILKVLERQRCFLSDLDVSQVIVQDLSCRFFLGEKKQIGFHACAISRNGPAGSEDRFRASNMSTGLRQNLCVTPQKRDLKKNSQIAFPGLQDFLFSNASVP